MPSQIKSGAFLSYVGIVINILISLIFTPWMISTIGKDNFGLYTLAMSVITLFVFDFGLSSAVTRYISLYLARGEIEKANNCIGLIYKLYFFIDIFLFIILTTVYFFIPQIYESLSSEEIEQFKIVYIIASAFSIVSLPFIPLNGILTATEKFIQLKLCIIANKLIIVVTMSVCLLLGYGLIALVSVNAFAGIIMIAMKYFCIRKYTLIRVNLNYSNKQERNQILGFSGWVTVIAISQRMIFNIAPSILGIMSGATSIAILGVAITIEGSTFTFANAINGMFMPKVSRIYSNDDGNILPLMIKVGRFQVMIIFTIAVIFFCIGHEFIQLWVGKDFDNAFWCSLLLIIPSVIQLPQEIAQTAVVVANKVRYQAYCYLMMAIVNIGLAFWLSHLWGALGICASICIAYFVRTICLNILYRIELSVDLKEFFIKTYRGLALPFILIVVSAYLINVIFEGLSWYNFIFKGAVLILVSLVSFWIFYMSSYEKKQIKSLFLR